MASLSINSDAYLYVFNVAGSDYRHWVSGRELRINRGKDLGMLFNYKRVKEHEESIRQHIRRLKP